MVLLNAEIMLPLDSMQPSITIGMILLLLRHPHIQVLPITQIMSHMFSRQGHFIPVVPILLEPFKEFEPKIYQRREMEAHSLWFLLMAPLIVSQANFRTVGSACMYRIGRETSI